MIKIKHKNLEVIAQWHYENIINYINQNNTKYNFDNINCDLVFLFDIDLEQIIKLTPDKMRKLIQSTRNANTKNMEQFKNLYEVFRNKWATTLIHKLNIDVCPYCNREYIFKFTDSIRNSDRLVASFDHYYLKSQYPYLAISFYNLIPCCHICNSKFKHSKDFYNEKHLHPYEDDFNSLSKFHLNISNSSYLYTTKAFSIDLTYNDTKTKNSIDTFKLNDLYQNHKDIVLELIQKREIYPDSYIDELAHNYNGIFKNREDLLRLITCGYVEDKDLGKRPLSKLIKDISEELELV